jgi:hypothetical protein
VKYISIRIPKEKKEFLVEFSKATDRKISEFIIEYALGVNKISGIPFEPDQEKDGISIYLNEEQLSLVEKKAFELGFTKASLFLKYALIVFKGECMNIVPIRVTEHEKQILDMKSKGYHVNSISAYMRMMGVLSEKPGFDIVMEPDMGDIKSSIVTVYLDDKMHERLMIKSKEFGFSRLSSYLKYVSLKYYVRAVHEGESA